MERGLPTTIESSHGRALRRRGRAHVPREASNTEWPDALSRIHGAPAEAAAGWRANAATEAASIASFGHLANELLAVGAPPALVEGAHYAALDEVRHASLCYGVAAAMDGAALGPAPFPAALAARDRAPPVRAIAEESVVESCLFEGAAAAVARRLGQSPDVAPPIADALRRIAEDEACHALHGRAIVEWCVDHEGVAIVPVLLAALEHAVSRSVVGAVGDGLERHGLAGPSLQRACIDEMAIEVRAFLECLAAPRAAPGATRTHAAMSRRGCSAG